MDTGSLLDLLQDRMDLEEDGDFCEPTPLDLRGLHRVVGATIDMGASERP